MIDGIVFQVHRKLIGGWMAESGGQFVVGQDGNDGEAATKARAIAYANTVTEATKQPVKVVRTDTRQVWPVNTP